MGIAMIIILPGVGNQPPTPPVPTSAMSSLSLAPSSSFMPTRHPSASPSSNEEFQQNALVQIGNVLASDEWKKNDFWESIIDNMCSLYGVVCKVYGVEIFVTELNLAANNLTGDI